MCPQVLLILCLLFISFIEKVSSPISNRLLNQLINLISNLMVASNQIQKRGLLAVYILVFSRLYQDV